MLRAPPEREGLFGCGTLRDGAGEPLRPGGLALTRELIDRAGFARRRNGRRHRLRTRRVDAAVA